MSEGRPIPELDPIVHGPLRLAVLSLLFAVDQADFKWLREKTRATDGNLGANLSKLEQAGYISAKKSFIQKKPNSVYTLTASGRKALAGYVKALKTLLSTNM
jgi:DNA-binding HxlR family transcriptional regulator